MKTGAPFLVLVLVVDVVLAVVPFGSFLAENVVKSVPARAGFSVGWLVGYSGISYD